MDFIKHLFVEDPVPVGPIRYQSPIELSDKNVSFSLQQVLSVNGKNTGAILNETTNKNYEVKQTDKIILNANGIQYHLDEYHFHVITKSEHSLNGKKYDAEVHYVFVEDDDKQQASHRNLSKPHQCSSICDGKSESGRNYLVIGRFIQFSNKQSARKLNKLNVKLPDKFFQYDGTLTAVPPGLPANDYLPVRWIVGRKPLRLSEKDFNELNSKTSRPLQPLDGRLILAQSKLSK